MAVTDWKKKGCKVSIYPERWRSIRKRPLVRLFALLHIPVMPAGAFWMLLDTLRRSEEDRMRLKYRVRELEAKAECGELEEKL